MPRRRQQVTQSQGHHRPQHQENQQPPAAVIAAAGAANDARRFTASDQTVHLNDSIIDCSGEVIVHGDRNRITGGTNLTVHGDGNVIGDILDYDGGFEILYAQLEQMQEQIRNGGELFHAKKCIVHGNNNTVHVSDASIQGDFNTVHGASSDVLGNSNIIKDGSYSTVRGNHNIISNANGAEVNGNENNIDGISYGEVNGDSNTINDSDCVTVVGNNNNITESSFASVRGNSNRVSGDNVSCVGDHNTVQGSWCDASGNNNIVSGHNSRARGGINNTIDGEAADVMMRRRQEEIERRLNEHLQGMQEGRLQIHDLIDNQNLLMNLQFQHHQEQIEQHRSVLHHQLEQGANAWDRHALQVQRAREQIRHALVANTTAAPKIQMKLRGDDEASTDTNKDVCFVCHDNKAVVASFCCGKLTSCISCSKILYEDKDVGEVSCLNCREVVRNVARIS